jgi:hypothetical protein
MFQKLHKLFLLVAFFQLTDAFTMNQRLAITPLQSSSRSPTVVCNMAKQTNDEFWEAQRRMAAEMSDSVSEEEMQTKETNREKYRKKVFALVTETLYFSAIIFSAIWFLSPNPFTAISYLLGATLGTAYTYGLGKSVEALGGSAYDAEDLKGSGVGSARFAFLIVLFIFVGRFRSAGLQEIPAIMGFFTYQFSTLSQGLKDAFDDSD